MGSTSSLRLGLSILTFVFIAQSSSEDEAFDPRLIGPFDVKTVRISPSSSVDSPPFEIVAFLPELKGLPGNYAAVLSHIASHGIAVVGSDIPTPRTAVEGALSRAKDVAEVLRYLTADDAAAFQHEVQRVGGPAEVFLDVKNGFGLLAHSIGGHAMLQMIESISCFGAQFIALMDPVDGLDPYGFEKQFLIPPGIHPEVKVNFSVPVVLLVTGYGWQSVNYPSILHWPACAPANRSGMHWFSSLQNPKWFINFTDYGHMDLLDEGFSCLGEQAICPVGPGAVTLGGRDQYRKTLAALTVSLAAAFLPDLPRHQKHPQETYVQWLEQPSLLRPLSCTSISSRGKNETLAGICRRSTKGEEYSI
jgi:hypothetical protein